MNTRLKRILGEIQKTEQKIAEWQEHLRELHMRKKQVEDAEIIKSVRSMKLDSRQLLEVLESIQNGKVTFPDTDILMNGADTEELTDMGNMKNPVTETMNMNGQTKNAAGSKEDDNRENEN